MSHFAIIRCILQKNSEKCLVPKAKKEGNIEKVMKEIFFRLKWEEHKHTHKNQWRNMKKVFKIYELPYVNDERSLWLKPHFHSLKCPNKRLLYLFIKIFFYRKSKKEGRKLCRKFSLSSSPHHNANFSSFERCPRISCKRSALNEREICAEKEKWSCKVFNAVKVVQTEK